MANYLGKKPMSKKLGVRYRRYKRLFNNNKRVRRLRKFVSTKQFAKHYMWFSVLALMLTALFWSILSARVQLSNADQLIDPMLFQSASTFHQALLPSAHSFLLKWPLFFAIKSAGLSSQAYVIATVTIVLATISILAGVIYKIERRPLYLGTIYLGMSSVLMLVPTAAYSGALLPVNMAMVATRNLEYIVYILALVFIVRAKNSFSSLNLWTAILLLGVLFASDKLFLGISIASSILLVFIYAIFKKWDFVKIWLRWLAASVLAALFAIVLLSIITKLGITKIVSNGVVGPYSSITGIKEIVIGSIHAVLGIFTNLGANPAFDSMSLKNLPSHFFSRLISASGPAYIINGLILVASFGAVLWLLRASFAKKPKKAKNPRTSFSLSIMLIAASIITFGSFIFTNHYYPADARYLGIVFFTSFICLSTFVATKHSKPLIISAIGAGLIFSVTLGSLGALKIYHQDRAALKQTDSRNYLVSQAMANHKVNFLVGDYWRVVPTKFISKNNIEIAPLATCTQYRNSLTSKTWQPNLKTTSFAYLISTKKGLTDFPACSYEEVVNNYGRPSSSILIAGTLDDPEEMLLFYDTGKHNLPTGLRNRNSIGTLAAATVALNKVPNTACKDSQTIMQVVAHQDDDLLFMSPDLLHDIEAKNCIRTIYITAGDAGANEFYWSKREQGSESAYAYMLGIKDDWAQKNVKLPGGQFISIASPKSNPKISLIFLHLPDGGLNGQGFVGFYHQSIDKLQTNRIPSIKTVDNQSHFTHIELTKTITDIMDIYKPVVIKVQDSSRGSGPIVDHSDHNASGRLATEAFERYAATRPADAQPSLIRYLGYPARLLSPNVEGSDLTRKIETFIEYGKFDGAVCQSLGLCENSPTYSNYLDRQYVVPN